MLSTENLIPSPNCPSPPEDVPIVVTPNISPTTYPVPPIETVAAIATPSYM